MDFLTSHTDFHLWGRLGPHRYETMLIFSEPMILVMVSDCFPRGHASQNLATSSSLGWASPPHSPPHSGSLWPIPFIRFSLLCPSRCAFNCLTHEESSEAGYPTCEETHQTAHP